MTITTNVEQVKLHIMTEQQYDDSAKSDSELYVITDATAMPMDDELSLSSENPVKNNVIKERFDEVQTELDDKLNKSVVWNKLNRAYGWTYRHLNGAGNAYLMYYENGEYKYTDAISAQSVIENQTNKYYTTCVSVYYVCLDNQLYTKSYSNGNYTLTPIGNNNCICYATSWWNSYNCLAIIDNNLYNIEGSTLTLIDSGQWAKITNSEAYNSEYGFGIKDGKLYYFNRSNNELFLKDDTGIWTEVIGSTNSSSKYGFGIKDGKLYSLNANGSHEISSETGWTQIVGYLSNSAGYGLGIKNGALYKIKYNSVELIDNTETWIKIDARYYALTQSGKLYTLNSDTLTQIGVDTSWTDISNNFGIKNGDVYYIQNDEITKITNFGNITKIYNNAEYWDSMTSALFWTGSVTEDVHNVYTVAAPSIDFDTYSDVNLTKFGTITSVSSSPYVVTDEHYTYNRNSNIDGVFTGISLDSSKQLMSMSDFLKCFTE